MAIARTAVEQFFGDFVVKSGGQLVSSIISGSTLPPNADYYFRDSAIIGELKCLQIDSFGLNYQVKLQELVDSWMERRLYVLYGRTQIDIRQVPPICQREWMDLIGAPLQRNLLAPANRQIRETKKLLNLPNLKGILFLSSDGNNSLQPYDVMYFVSRTLNKTRQDGSRQYSNIDGIVYFSLSMLSRLPDIPVPIQFWTGGSRDSNDMETREFIDRLEELWYKFQCQTIGQPMPRIETTKDTLRNLKFI